MEINELTPGLISEDIIVTQPKAPLFPWRKVEDKRPFPLSTRYERKTALFSSSPKKTIYSSGPIDDLLEK